MTRRSPFVRHEPSVPSADMSPFRRALLVATLSLGTVVAVTASAAAQLPPAQPPILIRNGTVLVGDGSTPVRLDLRIRGGRIVGMAPRLVPENGEREIDATGLMVAPGFIDLHSHADRGLDQDPGAESHVRQGITTALIGQDGSSPLPISGFLDRVDALGTAINFAALVGHGTVRSLVMGADFRRAATESEIGTMAALVDRGMADGAFGLSSGLEYDPGHYSEAGELRAIAAAVRRRGGFYASHVRDEERGVLAAWREAIDVGRRTGVPVHISHMKLAARSTWGRAAEALLLVDSAAMEGLDVTGDWYPYPFWSSSIYVLVADRQLESLGHWEDALREVGGAENVLITGFGPDSTLNGKSLAEVALARGADPAGTAIALIREGGPRIGVIVTAMQEADLEEIAAHPRVMIASDGSLHGAHPRNYGAFPRVLSEYVRSRAVISLPDAVRKMTSAPAARLGLGDRGTLAPGWRADIVIFDAASVQDTGTRLRPAGQPRGIHHVIVNGELVLEAGRMTGARPGRAIRSTTERERGSRGDP